MLHHVKTSDNDTFIIATEAGILHKMQLENPDKILIPAPSEEDNTCACSECAFMKVNTLEKIYDCLLNEKPEINLKKDIIEKAKIPILKMLDLK